MKSAERCVALAAVLAATWAFAGCGGNGGTPSTNPLPAGTGVSGEVSLISSTGAQGTLLSGVIPVGSGSSSDAAPVLTVGGGVVNPVTVAAGGTLNLEVTSSRALSDILVGVPGQPGYYDVKLPGGGSPANGITYQLGVTVPASAAGSTFTLEVVTENTSGGFSQPATLQVVVSGSGGTTSGATTSGTTTSGTTTSGTTTSGTTTSGTTTSGSTTSGTTTSGTTTSGTTTSGTTTSGSTTSGSTTSGSTTSGIISPPPPPF